MTAYRYRPSPERTSDENGFNVYSAGSDGFVSSERRTTLFQRILDSIEARGFFIIPRMVPHAVPRVHVVCAALVLYTPPALIMDWQLSSMKARGTCYPISGYDTRFDVDGVIYDVA